MRGTVVEVRRMEPPVGETETILGSVLIDGVIEADTKYDKAALTITTETVVYDQRGGERIQVTFEAVREGLLAEATFAGPVKETYPLQGFAAELVIVN